MQALGHLQGLHPEGAFWTQKPAATWWILVLPAVTHARGRRDKDRSLWWDHDRDTRGQPSTASGSVCTLPLGSVSVAAHSSPRTVLEGA